MTLFRYREIIVVDLKNDQPTNQKQKRESRKQLSLFIFCLTHSHHTVYGAQQGSALNSRPEIFPQKGHFWQSKTTPGRTETGALSCVVYLRRSRRTAPAPVGAALSNRRPSVGQALRGRAAPRPGPHDQMSRLTVWGFGSPVGPDAASGLSSPTHHLGFGGSRRAGLWCASRSQRHF